VFAVVESSSSSAALRLSADQSTLAMYPFRFELDVRFSIEGHTLTMVTHVRNRGDEPMPASLGFHPGFRWPVPGGAARSAHYIEFSEDEPAPARRLDSRGLLSPARHPTPIVGRRLPLADTLFQNDALIFDDLRSRWVTYGADGTPRIRLGLGDAPYLGIWSKPGAGFVCIEPWHGIADSAGFTGDFRDKPQVFSISPGAAVVMPMMVTLLPATGDASR
jgi:galactose mutarotase-like enzyme